MTRDIEMLRQAIADLQRWYRLGGKITRRTGDTRPGRVEVAPPRVCFVGHLIEGDNGINKCPEWFRYDVMDEIERDADRLIQNAYISTLNKLTAKINELNARHLDESEAKDVSAH